MTKFLLIKEKLKTKKKINKFIYIEEKIILEILSLFQQKDKNKYVNT